MSRGKRVRLVGGFCGVLFACALVSGCATNYYVTLDHADYAPGFSTDCSAYQGKTVFLTQVDNQAQNTNNDAYYSRDEHVTYAPKAAEQTEAMTHWGGWGSWIAHHAIPYLSFYFTDAMERGLRLAGLNVVRDERLHTAGPRLQFVLKSIDDEEFAVQAVVSQPGRVLLDKKYRITEPPVPRDARATTPFAQRAYKMLNNLVEAVLSDPDFQKAVVSAQ